jgi:hypothetical protein
MSANARAARREAQQRVNRLLLVGTLAGLALFFGIIVAQDVAEPGSLASQTFEQRGQSGLQPIRPRVRTRTS